MNVRKDAHIAVQVDVKILVAEVALQPAVVRLQNSQVVLLQAQKFGLLTILKSILKN